MTNYKLILLIILGLCSCGESTNRNYAESEKIIVPNDVLIGQWHSFLKDDIYEYDKRFTLKEDGTGIYIDSQTYNSGSKYTTSAYFEITWKLDTINFEYLAISFKKGKMGGDDFNDEDIKKVINKLSFSEYKSEIIFENENAFRFEIGERKHRFIRTN